jgi:homoserine acetyltransferase
VYTLSASGRTSDRGEIAAAQRFSQIRSPDALPMFEKSRLAAIRARAIVMPGQTDLYFPPEDSQYEVMHMPNAECRPIPSIWGHCAGCMNLNPPDTKFIDDALKELLAH